MSNSSYHGSALSFTNHLSVENEGTPRVAIAFIIIIIQFNVTVDGTFDWPYSDREEIQGGTNIKILIKSYCNFLDY